MRGSCRGSARAWWFHEIGDEARRRSVATMAFEHPGKWQDRTFELAGDELSMAELAEVFTRAAGREVRYTQVPWDEF